MDQRTEGGITYVQSWNAYNKLESVTWEVDGTPCRTEFIYDGDGNRLLKIENMLSPFGAMGTLEMTTLYLGTYERQFNTTDSPSGTPVSGVVPDGVAPIGACLGQSVSPTDFGFTGQRNERGFGLMDYNARMYSPRLGRFVSPDNVVPDPSSSAGFNRYRYARNSPLNFVDPTGHCEIRTADEDGQEHISKWNCTVDDFAELDWGERKRWVELFMEETETPWFQNILGILDFFGSDPSFAPHDGWASVSDAAVLQAINDGWLLAEGNEAIGPSGDEDASRLWQSFFISIEKRSPDARSKWGAAEQAGVDYGLQVAGPLLDNGSAFAQWKAKNFVRIGNIYRFMVENEMHRTPLISSFESVGFAPLDPRTTDSRLFVNVAGMIGSHVDLRQINPYKYIFCPTGTCLR